MLQALGELIFGLSVALVVGVSNLIHYAVVGAFYLVVTLLEVIPQVIQVLILGLNEIGSFTLYLTRSAYYVFVLSWEVISQLDWQYAFDVLGEIMYTLSTGIATFTSSVCTGIWIILSNIALLLASICVLIGTALNFIIFFVWNFIVNVGSSIAAIMSEGGESFEMITYVISNVLVMGAFFILLTVCLVVMLRCMWRVVRFISWCFKGNSINSTNLSTGESSRQSPRVEERLTELQMMREQVCHRVSEQLHSPNNSTRLRKTDSFPDKELKSQKLKQELEETKKELAKHQEEKLCAVCYDNPRVVVLHPCNHYCLCDRCRRELRRCPICNMYIQSSEKIYNV